MTPRNGRIGFAQLKPIKMLQSFSFMLHFIPRTETVCSIPIGWVSKKHNDFVFFLLIILKSLISSKHQAVAIGSVPGDSGKVENHPLLSVHEHHIPYTCAKFPLFFTRQNIIFSFCPENRAIDSDLATSQAIRSASHVLQNLLPMLDS